MALRRRKYRRLLPAILSVDDKSHPIARGIPQTFLSPSNEWYVWAPSPRLAFHHPTFTVSIAFIIWALACWERNRSNG
jgi:hypothetical protein